MKKILVGFIGVCLYISSFGDTLYCPTELSCVSQQCHQLPTQLFIFNSVIPADGISIPDGNFHFSGAISNSNNMYQCSYRNNNGNTIAYLTTSLRLMPLKTNDNSWSGSNDNYWCITNSKSPYWSDPTACPFLK